MTIEEKAKAYDEAIKEIKELISLLKKNDAITDNGIIESNLQRIFPQLRESEAERIRKALIWHLKADADFVSNGVTKTECIAWLEKQKDPHFTKRNALFDKCVENCDPEIMKRVSDEVDKMLEKEQKLYWKPTKTDVALLNKAIITNNTLTPIEREQLDIIRSRFGYCRASNCNGIIQEKPNSAEGSDDERIRKDIIALIKFGLNDGSAVSPGSHTTKEEALAYLEKQKDASYAIEAVDRIDKYIDEHLANAHDMKDSNPDKKYYRGWDDALGKMAGILQDVYSGEKQKESLRDFIDDFPYSTEQKEQDWNKKPCLTCQEYEKGHNQGYTEGCTAGYNKAMKERNEEILGLDGNPICYDQKSAEINLKVLLTADCLASAEMTGRFKERNEILENPEKYGLQKPVEIDEYKIIKKHITEDSLSSEVNKRLKECGWYVTDEKTAEWSDEDSRMLSDIAGYISGVGSSSGITKRERVDFLYELPKRFNLQPKQNWSEEDKKKINFLSRLIEFQVKDDEYCSSDGRFISKQEAIEMLKSLCPQPKSEWSEDIIRKAVKEIGLTQHQIDWFKDNVFPSKVEWSEEDEGELQNAIDALEFLGKKGVYKSESGYDAALQAASWLKNLSLSLKKRNEDVTKLCSNEWSEEDKQKLNRIYEILGYAADDRGFLTSKRIIGDKEAIELQDFLSSLRLQPKQEWSEEDELMIKCCLRAIEHYKYTGKPNVFRPSQFDIDGYLISPEKVQTWLKLLRNRVGKESLQPHWKPTNEQMKALKDAKMRMSLTGYGLCPILQSLITDLQKLP